MEKFVTILQDKGITPTPQRLAVARHVLGTKAHPSADQVLEHARRSCPTVSRATVYNTLNLLVVKGMLKARVLRGGTIVFDPLVEIHHHFIDDETGKIYDIPWDAVRVTRDKSLEHFEVREYQVVMRGRRKRNRRSR